MSEPSPNSLTRPFDVLVVALAEILAVVQDARALVVLAADAAVELHATDAIEIVALGREEQVLEQVLRGFLGRRLARTHHAVDLDQRLERRLGRIDAQRLAKCSRRGRDR